MVCVQESIWLNCLSGMTELANRRCPPPKSTLKTFPLNVCMGWGIPSLFKGFLGKFFGITG